MIDLEKLKKRWEFQSPQDIFRLINYDNVVYEFDDFIQSELNDLRCLRIQSENIHNLNLSLCCLDLSVFNECIFKKVSFQRSELKYTEFNNCTFENCNLSMIDVNKSIFKNCRFLSCEIMYSHFKTVNFDNCIFEASDGRLKFQYVNFINTSLNFKVFQKSEYYECTDFLIDEEKRAPTMSSYN